MNHNKFIKLQVRPKLENDLEHLRELSYNLWSTWDKNAQQLFKRIDPVLFRKCNHNPVKLLYSVPSERLEELASDTGFRYELQNVMDQYTNYMKFTGSYKDSQGEEHVLDENQEVIAYFSMEYGLHESLPVYSGGLGVLAGDYLKAASDQGIPMVAFGLLYKFGYFRQSVNIDGMQEEGYSLIDWYTKPVQQLKNSDGKPLLHKIKLGEDEVWFKTWIINVGRVKLYLLDSDIPENPEHIREYSEILYDTRKNNRIAQELLLAFGSQELMHSLNLNPSVYHLNEGHSAFLIIDRLRYLTTQLGYTYQEAKELIYHSTVFTTHTPVIAGNENFPISIVKNYIRQHAEDLQVPIEKLIDYGKVPGDNTTYWLSALALRFSRCNNAVSQLHKVVSKSMWEKLYPELYVKEVPIIGITNGVHLQSWVSEQILNLFNRYIGPEYTHIAERRAIWENVKKIPLMEIWEAHKQRKDQMISFIRSRMEKSFVAFGDTKHLSSQGKQVLANDTLTIGFARRFATYKRADLILEDPERLLSIMNNPEKPVQFVFAGKAHPADEAGKLIIKRLIDFALENNIQDKFIFVPNYDMNIARHLVQGVDVWLNNPVKPMEASGTSGMKAGMNGVLNLSVLDGWWAEGYSDDIGWAIPSLDNVVDDSARRRMEANFIYDLIENYVCKQYYDRGQSNFPERWVEKMRMSIYKVGMNFNMHRMLREYVDYFYVETKEKVEEIFESELKCIKGAIEYIDKVKETWDRVRIEDVSVSNLQNFYESCDEIKVTAIVDLAGTDPAMYTVEVMYIYNDEGDFATYDMHLKDYINDKPRFVCRFNLIDSGLQKVNVRIKTKSAYKGSKEHVYIKWKN